MILILSQQWDVNIIAGSDIAGQVNGTFRDESLKSILDSILIANNLLFQQIGNSLVVLPISDTGGNRPSFRVEVLDARVQSDQEMEQLIAALKLQMSPEGQLVPINATGKLTVLDTPERIEAVKQLLQQITAATAHDATNSSDNPSVRPSNNGATQDNGIDGGLLTRALGGNATNALLNTQLDVATIELRPKYILAVDLKESLSLLVGDTNFAIVENENAIVIFGDAAVQQKARAFVQQIDRPRPQVRITGYIYDVDLGEMERLGVDWGQQMMSTAVDANGVPRNLALSGTGLLSPAAVSQHANTLTGVATEAAGAAAGAAGGAAGAAGAAAATGPVGGQFLFRTLNSHFQLVALIQALDQTDGSRLLADPHVIVSDRHRASLGIVTEIPVQQLTQTQQGGAIGTTEFKEAGITLDVTPRIASDGTIEMQVEPTFSVLSGFQDGQPIIDTRRASTVVRVTHGQALVIGGLRSKTTVETVKGIPGLMNVKYLGKLFRTHDTNVRESEMIVFNMPEIVGYCTPGLEREELALQVAQQQLSRVQTAVDGPFTPDCKDCFCPHHNERPRIHAGFEGNGLIGNHDSVFIAPYLPGGSPESHW